MRHNKRPTRLNHRGCAKVNPQWSLYCMVHNIEKLVSTQLGQAKAH
ncbi:MAG: transposase [Burkholderiales bacterium]